MRVARWPDFEVAAVICDDDHRGWAPAEQAGAHQLVLVRRGMFRRRARSAELTVDRALGYLTLPGDEQSFAHPAGGDDCTAVTLGPELWHELAGEARPARSAVYVDARLELAHRRLLTAARDDDVTAELVDLAVLAATRTLAGPLPSTPARGPRAAAADRALVDQARAAIAADHPSATGLLPLARLLGVSPYRLSRAFPRELGVSLTRYRNRIRTGRALDRLAAGEHDLAALAADLGFADQPHLTRTLRAQVGHTPTVLRRLLTG